MRIYNLFKQLFFYSFFGLIINSIGYSLYLLLTSIGFLPKVVMSFLYLLGLGVGFLTNKKWTFMHEGNFLNTGVRYIFAHTLGYLLNLSILIVMVDKLGYSHEWIQAIAIIIVALFLFILFKFCVFRSLDNSKLDYK